MQMAEAKQSEAWNHTSSLIAWIVKVKLGKKGRAIKPQQFHPFAKKQKVRLSNEASRARLNQFARQYDGKRKGTASGEGGHRTVDDFNGR